MVNNMGKVELKVKFETLTPLWTGNAWGQCMEIRPSSILGSLRFWFEVLCYFSGIINDDYFDEDGKLIETLDYNKFREQLKEKIKDKLKNGEGYNIEELIDETLNELNISLPSRIFGCTGWKGRIRIKEIIYKKKEICKDNLDFYLPLNKLNKNSRFWIQKCIFNNGDKISIFEDIIITIDIEKYWFEKYLKRFFKFYKDKIILIGGKNSFGFGFVKLNIINEKIDKTEDNVDSSIMFKEIKLNVAPEKDILGFNFKYYLRCKERKRYRKKNFGEQGKSSNFYVSNLIKNNNNFKIILFGINNPFNKKYKENNFSNIFNKYCKWLENI